MLLGHNSNNFILIINLIEEVELIYTCYKRSFVGYKAFIRIATIQPFKLIYVNMSLFFYFWSLIQVDKGWKRLKLEIKWKAKEWWINKL